MEQSLFFEYNSGTHPTKTTAIVPPFLSHQKPANIQTKFDCHEQFHAVHTFCEKAPLAPYCGPQ